MRIGELSKLSGVAVETIRFYENEGLIPKAARSMNNYRSYTESHLKRLQFIRHCRSLDMSLEDIKLLSDVGARRNEEACKVQEIISRHMKKIDEQINALKELRQHLGLLSLCCHGNHANGEPCGTIVKTLKLNEQSRKRTYRNTRISNSSCSANFSPLKS